MLDDFFLRAVLGAIGVAIVTGPLGCFVVWRRLAYFGDTLSHSALLGVALAILLEVNITLAVFVISILMGLALLMLRQIAPLSSDALLGLLAHSTLALGLIALSFMTWVRVDLLGFLFGDVLAINQFDLLVIGLGGTIVLIVLKLIWRSLFAATVSPEIARAEGLEPKRAGSHIYDTDGFRNRHLHENRRSLIDHCPTNYSCCCSEMFFQFPRTDGCFRGLNRDPLSRYRLTEFPHVGHPRRTQHRGRIIGAFYSQHLVDDPNQKNQGATPKKCP